MSILRASYVVFVVGAASLAAHASHENGTGEPDTTINLAQSQDQRTVIQLDYQGVTLLGSTQLEQGYGEATLDAVDATGLRTDWGRAEIVAGCDQADVIVYQLQDGLEVEVLATQVALDGCAAQ